MYLCRSIFLWLTRETTEIVGSVGQPTPGVERSPGRGFKRVVRARSSGEQAG